MMKKALLLAMSLLVFGALAYSADKTFVGTVSDEHCGAKHAVANEAAEGCVEKCHSGGAAYVLVSHGKVYKLDAQDKFNGMGGKSVKVTGTLSGDSITVSSVAPAGGHHKKAAAKS